MGAYAGPAHWWTDNTDPGRTHIATKGIVQTGLVVNLDAGASTSYSGSGTTWTDISGRVDTGTLTNGPTYSASNGGYITCDGTNDYIMTNNTSLNSQLSSSSDISFFLWIYPTSAGQILVELGEASISAVWHATFIELSTAGAFSFSIWNGSNLTNKVVSSNQSFNQWYYIGLTYSGTTLTAYLNGASIGTATLTRQTPWSAAYQSHYALCSTDSTNMGTQGYGGARIATFTVYSRGLTATEVAQNFNAVRGRFGI